MDEAFIQHAEHDVDHKDRNDEQRRQVLERFLEFFHRALKAGG
jgi:hypothetical protein